MIANGTDPFAVVPEEAFEQFGMFEEHAVDFTAPSATSEIAGPPDPQVMLLPGAIWLLGRPLGALGPPARRRGRT